MSTPAPTLPRTACSIEEAALSLGISRRTVYTLIHGGQLRTVAAGRRRLVPIEELQRFARLPAGAS
ncbi:MAG: helix-turn-helix domain-containing protein [Steroidobacteraceae bacterium]